MARKYAINRNDDKKPLPLKPIKMRWLKGRIRTTHGVKKGS